MSHIQTTQLDAKLKQKIIQICEDKIRQKGEKGGLSFYAFFANKNDDPETLMQVATWWIKTHQLDHFEKAIKKIENKILNFLLLEFSFFLLHRNKKFKFFFSLHLNIG